MLPPIGPGKLHQLSQGEEIRPQAASRDDRAPSTHPDLRCIEQILLRKRHDGGLLQALMGQEDRVGQVPIQEMPQERPRDLVSDVVPEVGIPARETHDASERSECGDAGREEADKLRVWAENLRCVHVFVLALWTTVRGEHDLAARDIQAVLLDRVTRRSAIRACETARRGDQGGLLLRLHPAHARVPRRPIQGQ